MLLYIIGFSRAGKSRLAQNLASSWQISAYDTDLVFCQEERTSIAEYVKENGWNAFRKRESEILMGSPSLELDSPSSNSTTCSGVVACGGGIVELAQNRDFLRSQRVLWLAPPLELLLSRIKLAPSAYFQGKSEAEIITEYHRRLPLYRDCLAY